MEWWAPWTGQGYNILDLMQERNQTGSQANLLSDAQMNALVQYFVGGQQDTSMLENVQGEFSTLAPYSEEVYTQLQEDPLEYYSSEFSGEFDENLGWNVDLGHYGEDWTTEQLAQSETYGPMWENVQSMAQGGTNYHDIMNYIQSLNLGPGMARKFTDFAGGGGIGGTSAKNLFSPAQQTGFAGVGSGVSGGKYGGQNTMDDLLKTMGE